MSTSKGISGFVVFLLLVLCDLVICSQHRQEKFYVKPATAPQKEVREANGLTCTFTYQVQGGTKEQWVFELGSYGHNDLKCQVYRPDGQSYLFFNHFRLQATGGSFKSAEVKGSDGAVVHESQIKIDKKRNAVDDTKLYQHGLTSVEVIVSASKDEL